MTSRKDFSFNSTLLSAQVVALMLALLMGCRPLVNRPTEISLETPPMKHTPTPPARIPINPDSLRVEDLLAQMNLEQKIGQIMMIGFDGFEPDADLSEMITRYRVGGVILFARNVDSPEQVARLTNALQSLALGAGGPGLLLAIDQEGGRVARLTEDHGFSEFPGGMALGATGDPYNARRIAVTVAQELKAIGLNTDFAPVLDVNNNPLNPVIGIRSFGSDPQAVARFGTAYIEGLQSEGVLAFGKHFPGHGDTTTDSHLALPVVVHRRPRLEAVEFVPFRAAIRAGVAGIMSAHVTFPAIAGENPAPSTLSGEVLTGLLRDELHFDGLTATDSLEMGALAESGYPAPQAAVLALKAGADLLLFNRDHDLHQAAFAALMEAVNSGQVSHERLDSAVRRVLRAKLRFNLTQPAPVDPALAAARVSDPAHRQIARQIAAAGITLVNGPAGLLPVSPDGLLVIETPPAAGLAGRIGAQALAVDFTPTEAQTAQVMDRAQQARRVIFASADAIAFPAQAGLIQALLAGPTPVIVVAVRSPYDLLRFPHAPAYIAAYASNPPALDALADVLLGKAEPTGKLPMELPASQP
jgi:beta-N-acetylhexosaminidase